MTNVFISYSQADGEDHKKWVKDLADLLLDNGINAIVDQYDLTLGDRLPEFMEKSITEADYVLIICTPLYKEKADKRQGGVGYEGHIITGELYTAGNERKFIPVIRKGDFNTAMPVYLSGKLGVDLTDGPNYENGINDLLATLKGKRKKPSIIYKSRNLKKQDLNEDEPIRILGVVTDEVTFPRNDGTEGSALYKVPFRLSRRPDDLWKKLFVNEWNFPSKFSTMHRPGIASVVGDEIILDGTTIEEVQRYHRDTLVLCVNEANKKETEYLHQKQQQEEEKRNQISEHYSHVDEIANKIKF